MSRTCVFACLSLVLGLAHATGARALDVPALQAHVNDYANLLPADRAGALEARLSDFENRTGHQFALLTVSSLKGDALESFSIHVAEQWKLGHKGKDDGLIMLIVPSEHKMRIEVGYGLEGDIPDAIAARVVRDVLAPAFRSTDYAGGVDSAFAILMHAAGGGGDAPKLPPSAAARRPKTLFGPIFLPLLIFFIISLMSRGSRRRGGFFIGPMMGGGFGGGGWGGGGGGGGGWGGGGGGGFGGGGSSGNW